MNFEVRRTIGADHPSLLGHFPGAPVVPGVVILDEILAALTEWREDSHLTVIRAVKFLVPLKPEQPFTICLSASHDAETEVDFCCRVEDRVIVEGRLQVCCGASWLVNAALSNAPTFKARPCDPRRGNPSSGACVLWGLILIPPIQRLWIY